MAVSFVFGHSYRMWSTVLTYDVRRENGMELQTQPLSEHFGLEVQGVDLAEYQRSLLERFSNTYIKDKLSRLALDGSQKFMITLLDALLA